MKMLLIARLPHEPFNTLVREGKAEEKTKDILAALNPEATYFSEMDGLRTMVMIVNVADASGIPAIAEPLFLTFEARVEFHPVMQPEDLAGSGLDELGNQWG